MNLAETMRKIADENSVRNSNLYKSIISKIDQEARRGNYYLCSMFVGRNLGRFDRVVDVLMSDGFKVRRLNPDSNDRFVISWGNVYEAIKS